VILAVGVFPALLTLPRVQVPVPDMLAETTARAALRCLSDWQAATGAVPAAVLALTRTGLRALAWAKLKIALAMLAAVTVVGGGSWLIVRTALSDGTAAVGSDSVGGKKGRKTLADRLEGLPQRKPAAP
jgi:uncharacterized membrane protein